VNRILVRARFFAHIQTGPGALPASCTMVTGLSRGKSSWGVVLTTHPLLSPWLRMSRAIPLLPLWALGSLYRVKCTLPLFYIRMRKTDRAARTLTVGPTWRSVVKFTSWSLTPFGKETQKTLSRRLGGPQGQSMHFQELTNLLALQGIEPQTV
jgi:hypothetical protein